MYFEINSDQFHRFLIKIHPFGLYLLSFLLLLCAGCAYFTWSSENKKIFKWFHFRDFLPKRWIILILVSLAICLFTIPIITTWSLAAFHSNNVGGLLPIFDGGEYYNGAEHILDTGKIDSWNQRRPITSAFLATRLLVTNFDFRSTLLLQSMILGISVFLVALTISRTFGRCAGFLIFAVLFALSSFFLPENLSEILGLTFGCLSFSLIWYGIFERNYISFFFGLFFLTIGFLVRPGPFLLFPALFLVAGYLFSYKNRFNWKITIFSSVAVIMGILVNQLIIWFYSDGKGLVMGNYATTFYGLAAGGKGWRQSMIDFPYESTHYPESQLGPFLYQKSFELIHDSPLQFLNAIFNGYITGPSELFNQLYQLLIEYSANSVINRFGFALFLMVLICILIGIIRFFLYSDLKNVKILFLCSVITTFLALPFFFADGGIRTLEIVFPYLAIGIVIGTIGWRSRLAIQKNTAPIKFQSLCAFTIPLIIGIMILAAVGVTLAFGPELKETVLGKQTVMSPSVCSKNETHFIMRVDQGLPFLEMMETGDTNNSFAPFVRPRDFTSSQNERRVLGDTYYGLTDFIDGKDLPVLFRGYDLNSHRSFLILAPKGIITPKHRIVQFCAKLKSTEKLGGYRVYKLNSSGIG